jgi:16S rRNA processing protein RimM
MVPRSTSRSISDDDTLVVGQIRGPHGVRGEVRLDPRSDVPGRFAPGATLDCEGVGPLTITSLRGPADQPIVGFAGYDSREAALTLREKFLRVSRDASRQAIASGKVLWADLVGLAVQTPDGRSLGIVRDLLRAGAADVLVIDHEGKELLLPMIDTVVRSIDVSEGRIVVTPQEELS